MAEAGRMRLAVISPDGTVVHAWDSARIGRETLVQTVALTVQEEVVTGRGPFRRTRTVTTAPTVEMAVDQALRAFLLEVARM